MNSSASEVRIVQARKVRVTSEELVVDLVDGRTFAAPVHWYPRLAHGTPAERRNWTLIGRGEGIHWPDLDEDIAVEDLLAGRPSGESQISLQRWLKTRRPPASTRMQPSRRKPRVRSHHRSARG
jgi:hypothetical protein